MLLREIDAFDVNALGKTSAKIDSLIELVNKVKKIVVSVELGVPVTSPGERQQVVMLPPTLSGIWYIDISGPDFRLAARHRFYERFPRLFCEIFGGLPVELGLLRLIMRDPQSMIIESMLSVPIFCLPMTGTVRQMQPFPMIISNNTIFRVVSGPGQVFDITISCALPALL